MTLSVRIGGTVALVLAGLLLFTGVQVNAVVPTMEVTYSTGRPYSSFGESYYKIVGVVRNSGQEPVGFVQISADLFNATGQLVATGRDSFFWNIAPGEEVPFSLLKSYPNPNEITRHVLTATASSGVSGRPYRSVVPMSHQIIKKYSWSGSETLVGELLNVGSDFAEIGFLGGIMVGVYDASGQLIDLKESSSNYIRLLSPGQRTPFETSVGSDLPVASFKFFVNSILADTYPVPLSIAVTNTYVASRTSHIVGKVRNESSTKAENIRLVARFRDTSGKAIFVDSAEVFPSALSAGQEASFDLTVDASLSYAAYDLQAETAGTKAQVPFPAPFPTGFADGSRLSSLGVLLNWINPIGSRQVHLQVVPFNGDGPGVNLIRGITNDFFINPPQLGVGNYLMLPDMEYSWQVRTTTSVSPLAESAPGWGPWSGSDTFRTPQRDTVRLKPVSPPDSGAVTSGPAILQWENGDTDVFYYEVQASPDPDFGSAGPVASVWHNLVHGGVSAPTNSWRTPDLQSGTTYFWRVRPRVQGEGTPVAWSQTWSFRTP